MDEIIYKAELKALQERHKKEIRSLDIKFALSKALYKKGDIIKDLDTIILVDKISVQKDFSNSLPYVVYNGLTLKKDLTPMKRMEIQSIFSTRNSVELVKKGEDKVAE